MHLLNGQERGAIGLAKPYAAQSQRRKPAQANTIDRYPKLVGGQLIDQRLVDPFRTDERWQESNQRRQCYECYQQSTEDPTSDGLAHCLVTLCLVTLQLQIVADLRG